jgi:hypothetical protein
MRENARLKDPMALGIKVGTPAMKKRMGNSTTLLDADVPFLESSQKVSCDLGFDTSEVR